MALSTKVRYIIVAPLIGLAGLGLGVAGVGEYNTASSLKSGGVEVPGKVVDGRIKTGRRNSKTHYLTVSYEPKPGEPPLQHEFQVSKAGFDKAEQSPDVQLRILPSDPNVVQLIGEEGNGFLYMGIGAGCLIASAFLFRQIFKKETPPPVVELT